MTPTLPRGLLALALLFLPLSGAAQKKPGDYKVEDFMRHAQYTAMQLSPNGERLAAGVPYKGRTNLVIIELGGKRSRNIVTGFETVDAVEFFWVNDERVCLRAADGQNVSGEFNYRGTYCVDANGENLRDYTKLGVRNPAIGGFTNMLFYAPYYDGSPDYLVGLRERSKDSVDLYRFNTRTGRRELLTSDSPGDVQRWVLDHDRVPRIAVSQPERKGDNLEKRTVWYRDTASAKWERLFEYEMLGSEPVDGGVSPIAFDYDNSTLYVSSNVGRDKRAIYKYDTKARKMGDVMFEDPLVDVSGGLAFDRVGKKFLGISYQADKPVVRWVDPDMDKLQRSIDATFPKTRNSISFPGNSRSRLLIYSYSDVDPGTYHLYDRERNGVEALPRTREWLDPSLMSERRFIKYKARDGREIPAFVTIPRDSDGKNLPLIVNIHGGPWARSYTWSQWGRWPEAQFFASRGYVVLEPEPRGSLGWGRDHWKSSFKQWGQAMQDDITDGALHLAKEGIVDKNRMCLHGGSYGGYASAMGLAKDPDLWRCGSPFLAVTDLFMFQKVVYSDIAQQSDFFDHDFKVMVGDSRADREMFTRNSPTLQAGKIKAAVFLTMGGNDVRVPQVHGDEFYNALKTAGVKVEYKVYPGEAHGYNKDENVYDFYRSLEKFFAENLKK
ncbi:MAG TPA: prolyl oligopeptidase family serine peptidase [Usitatibacter sp.]|nr:prolyl oligopeptidase family serine peptidase [Usitatibacter sp.]